MPLEHTFISSKYRDITRRSDSASRRSPKLVELVTSQKTTVTVFFDSCGARASSSGEAQMPQ
jgi:hypothetical protein